MLQVDEETISAQIRDLFEEYYALDTQAQAEKVFLASRIAKLHDLLNCLVEVEDISRTDGTTY
jgi:hypothetical protein